MNKTEFLNKRLKDNLNCLNETPNILVKYRCFNDFTFDTLENNYLYICPAYKLDDETECTTSVKSSDLVDLENGLIKRKAVEAIVETVFPHATRDNIEQVKEILAQVMHYDGSISNSFLLDIIPDIQEQFPNVDATKLVNLCADVPNLLNEPENIESFKHFFSLCINARETIGVCSLTTSPDIEYMWKNYANDYSGYCIEYDFSDKGYCERLLPVIYEKEEDRDNNIVMNLMKDFISSFIEKVSFNQETADKTHMMRLILTKYDKWSYQDEWRIIGDPEEHFKAPKIKRILIGHNASNGNKTKLINFCLNNNIEYKIV